MISTFASTLFFIFFSLTLKMITKQFEEMDKSYIVLFTNGSLFNVRLIQASTKIMKLLVREFLIFDDTFLIMHTESVLQLITSSLAKAICI